MKFLIDNALSPIISNGLNDAGLEAMHVRDIDLQSAKDDVIFKYASEHYLH